MDVNNFTKTELELILHCVQVTLDWSLKHSDPKFYEGLEAITKKCEFGIHKQEEKKDIMKTTVQKNSRPETNVTTNIGDILAKLMLSD